MHSPTEADACAEELRAALAAHGKREATTLELLATPAEVSGVRRALRAYGADVQLCASELVTNVVQHLGEGVPVTVRVWCDDGGRTRLEVTDPDPRALPVLRASVGADEESGRGLALLDALAARWGVAYGPGRGKTVWCELEAGPGGGAVPVAPVVSARGPGHRATAGRDPR
ncbi:ATP-binding protein [Streptomyces sp. F-7]|uniref:ATP-binding protein n=1 Tax=Streptomyces sp. F-7 TaxID=573566 RepID=UPI000AB2A3C4|nr:ATP-binding protein [Streptomyces sp. F-7]